MDNPVKVILVTSYPFPDSSATANRLSTFASEMARTDNLDVVVVGPGSRKKAAHLITQDNLNYRIVSVTSAKYNRENLFLRAIGEYKQAKKLLKSAQFQNGDVYIVSIPSLLLILAVFFLRKKAIIFDFRDLVWSYLLAIGGVKSLVGMLIKLLIPMCLKISKAIVVTNTAEKTAISRLTGVPVTIVRNGISQERFTRLKHLNRPSKNEPYNVLYIGNIGIAQNLKTLIDAVGGDYNFKINIVGDGVHHNYLRNYVHQQKMANVHFIGALKWSDTLMYIEQANCLYGQIGASYKSAVPSKLFEYLSCGRSVVFGLPDGAAKTITLDFENIHICTPGDATELREKLLELKFTPITSTTTMQTNRQIIERHYLREHQAQSLINIVKSLI